MKRLLYILPLLVVIACSHEQAEETSLYRQYASHADITVAQINGFHLNDSVKVDVVILKADDSMAWQGLKEDFDIKDSEGVTSWMGDIDHPKKHVKRNVRPAWRAMAVHDEKIIAFYRVKDSIQHQALINYQLDKTENEK